MACVLSDCGVYVWSFCDSLCVLAVMLLLPGRPCRLPNKDGGALLVSALQGFAKYFFQCEVCRWVGWGSCLLDRQDSNTRR